MTHTNLDQDPQKFHPVVSSRIRAFQKVVLPPGARWVSNHPFDPPSTFPGDVDSAVRAARESGFIFGPPLGQGDEEDLAFKNWFRRAFGFAIGSPEIMTRQQLEDEGAVGVYALSNG